MSSVARSSLKERLEGEIPQLKQSLRENPFRATVLLRNWVAIYLPHTDWTCDYAVRQPEFFRMSADELTEVFDQRKHGVLCGGRAHYLMLLYRLFGFDAATYDHGVEGVYSHVVTLVSLPGQIADTFLLQDSLLNAHYVDARDGTPVPFSRLIHVIQDGHHADVRMETMSMSGRTLLIDVGLSPPAYAGPILSRGTETDIYQDAFDLDYLRDRHHRARELKQCFGMEDVLVCFQMLLRFWRASVPFRDLKTRHEFYEILRSLNHQAGRHRRPVVSILTPCLNAATYVECCIQSILQQGYPFVEHIIQDGGSTDGTADILKTHEHYIDWKSEKDGGQSDGLNQALQRCQGDIIGVLNADDEHLPHAAQWAVEQFAKDSNVAVIYGQQQNINAHGEVISLSEGPDPYDFEKMFRCEQVIPAQAAFIRRAALQAVGFYADVTRKTCPDYEMWVRLGLRFPVIYAPGLVARYRWHEGAEGSQETIVHKMVESKVEVIEKVCSDPQTPANVRKLRRQAKSGVYFWSAGHFLPPMTHGKELLATRQCWKGFWIAPSFSSFSKLVWHVLVVTHGHEAVRAIRARTRGRLRRVLRGLDRVVFKAAIYRFIYLPQKNLREEREADRVHKNKLPNGK